MTFVSQNKTQHKASRENIAIMKLRNRGRVSPDQVNYNENATQTWETIGKMFPEQRKQNQCPSRTRLTHLLPTKRKEKKDSGSYPYRICSCLQCHMITPLTTPGIIIQIHMGYLCIRITTKLFIVYETGKAKSSVITSTSSSNIHHTPWEHIPHISLGEI